MGIPHNAAIVQYWKDLCPVEVNKSLGSSYNEEKMFGISIPGGDELYYECIQCVSPNKGSLKSKRQGICSRVFYQVELHSDGLRGIAGFNCGK